MPFALKLKRNVDKFTDILSSILTFSNRNQVRMLIMCHLRTARHVQMNTSGMCDIVYCCYASHKNVGQPCFINAKNLTQYRGDCHLRHGHLRHGVTVVTVT